MLIILKGRTWNETQTKCAKLELENRLNREEAIRSIAARQRAERDLLRSMERERELVSQLLEQAKLVGKLRLRFGATEEEVEQERKRKEREEALDDVETDRLSTELHDRETLEQRRKDGLDDGFQEL